MKLNEIIYYIQNVLNKGPRSDDSLYSDRQVYFILKSIRAKLIKQKYDKYNRISEANYQLIDCMELTKQELYDCPCFTTDCKVLVTNYEIPNILNSRNLPLIEVYTPKGEKISRTTLNAYKYNKYSRTKEDKLFWFYHDNKIVVLGSTLLKAIRIKGIFEDPVELGSITSYCTSNVCFDPYTSNFPLDAELVDSLTKMAYDEFVRVMAMMPNDQTNNSNGEISKNP